MDKSLQKRLKSKDRELRNSAIDDLIIMNDKETFSALQVVAEGRKRTWFKSYGFDDQQYALEAMSRVATEEMRTYLSKFFTEKITEHNSLPWVDSNDVPIWGYELHMFPYAGGTLGQKLIYTLTLEYPNPWDESGKKQFIEHHHSINGDEWTSYVIIPYDKQAHNIRETILSKLKPKE